jgi:hypothetical protein
MNRILLILSVGLLLAGLSLAQDTTAPAGGSMPQQQQTPSTPRPQPQPQQASGTAGNASAASGPKIASGSVIPVQLTKSIDAKKAKTGDEVVAKVTQDMKTSSGDVLVPKDTKVVGHVTEAQPRSKEQKESQVGIAFDHAVMKNGSEVQLPMSIQAIIAPPNSNPSNGGGGYDQPASAPTGSTGGTAAGGGSGRSSGMGGSTPPPTPSPSAGGGIPSDTQAGANARGPITGQTQGVVGISNLTLSKTADTGQGSVVSSDKNNVKLDSGTLLLLRVR